MQKDHTARIKHIGLIFLLILSLGIIGIQHSAAEDSLCARVKIEIYQELTLERQAFDAHMRINNGFPDMALENVAINVTFSNEDGNPIIATSDPDNSGALFFIRLDTIENIDHVDGTGTVEPDSSADLHWLIIPAAGSAGDAIGGTLYYVGAELSYSMGGEDYDITVSPDYIFVKPMPELTLDYFLPEHVYGDDAFTVEIEPTVPFSLGVRVRNDGFGAACNLKIRSAQPQIVENEQGLLIGFAIEGSEVNEHPAAYSLLVDFGDIASGAAGTARWTMSCSLSGQFVEFTADYSHADELGGELTSLITAVNTHTLIHDVRVDLPGRDNIKDFLVKTENGVMVYESDLVDTPVTDQTSLSTINYEAQHDFELWHLLTVPVTTGFLYAKLQDPYDGAKVILEVVRSDGKQIAPENVWLSKERDEHNNWRYFFNLFDTDTVDTCRVIFADPLSVPDAPVLQFISDHTGIEGTQLSFVVEANDPDGAIPKLIARPLPPLANFVDRGNGTGIFDWTPALGQAGRYEITFIAADGVLIDSQRVALTIFVEGDRDGDGFKDEEELAAGSDPDNADSQPGMTALVLYAGYNQICFPAETMHYGDLETLLSDLGGSAVIEKVLVFDRESQQYREAGYDESGNFYGNMTLPAGQGLRGLIIYAKENASFEFTTKYCQPWDLVPGVNLTGSGCVPEGMTAFELLRAIDNETSKTNIQRFNPQTGQFETADHQDVQPTGIDFPIMPGEGYLLYRKIIEGNP